MVARPQINTAIPTKGKLRTTPAFPETAIDAVYGSLRHDGPVLSLAEMDAAVVGEAQRPGSPAFVHRKST